MAVVPALADRLTVFTCVAAAAAVGEPAAEVRPLHAPAALHLRRARLLAQDLLPEGDAAVSNPALVSYHCAV